MTKMGKGRSLDQINACFLAGTREGRALLVAPSPQTPTGVNYR